MNFRIPSIFAIFAFFFLLTFGAFLYLSLVKPKGYISPTTKKTTLALRGDIVTKNYKVAKSEKIYKVTINPQYIDPNKKELFVNLFSIYTGIPRKTIIYRLSKNYKKLKYKPIAYVDLKTAQNLKYLLKVLDKKRVFLKNHNGIREGYAIEDYAFKRVYPYNDTLEPILGRYNKITKRGENGLEEYYEEFLKPKQNGFIRGYRDVLGNIIYDKNVKVVYPKNGDNLPININLVLQRKIEKLLSLKKDEFQADEVIAAVIDSKSGKILALASSNRYNPNHINPKNIKNMKISAIREIFEPGSVMKPITFAILLQNNKVNPYEVLNGYNGVWKPKWRRRPIRDDEPFDWMSAENAIVYSSNIVISQLALRLSAKEFYEGLKNFGFSRYSGIDLPYELRGSIFPMFKFNYEIFKSSTSYGYGILVNFIQLLKAYNVFNNQGVEIIPKIANIKSSKKRVLSSKNAEIMLNILRKVVLKGTGKKALMDGIFTAGKTGTAQVSINGKYQKIYNSSFFGFANDKNHKYTIGVTFFRVKAPFPNYFASNTAVPTFKEIVNILINLGLLKGKHNDNKKLH